MAFTTIYFLIFFVGVGLVNFFIPSRVRPLWLLLTSGVFIAAFNLTSLVAVIFFASLNFLGAQRLLLQKTNTLFYSLLVFNVLAIIINNYLIASGTGLLLSIGSVEFQANKMLLLLGLSFYSLQHIAYLVEVNQKKILPARNYLYFLMISSYFPKFMSGPVTQYEHLSGQLPFSTPSRALMWQGFNRLLLGFFKKMVLADRLAPSVASVFDYNDTLPGSTIFTAAIFFTIQLYFDFSGYCDMAIGISKMLGIQLPENFNFPLRATSVTVFWRRWHQTLIGFLTTYVFYPISFRYRKLKKGSAAIAIMVTFFISGLWHGIGLTFLLWAFCHMLYLLAELYWKSYRPQTGQMSTIKKTLSSFFVMLLVAFSNVFFRATSTGNLWHLFSDLFNMRGFLPHSWFVEFVAPLAVGGHQLEHFNLFVTLFLVFFTLLFERKIFSLFNSTRFRPIITFLLLLVIFIFGIFNNGQRFIYMQF